jgi:predicted ATPase/DNA-binding CsgD family transcriptional regulator
MVDESATCETCGAAVASRRSGGRARYCSNACRQRAYRKRSQKERHPSKLPQPLDSFVGRRAELADLRRLVRQERLVTVVGPGGVGKTRLVSHLAAQAQRSYPGGVHVADLTSVPNPEGVPEAVASSLGITESVGEPVKQVVAALGDRTAILVLDNCEHVLTGCASLTTQLLDECRKLTMVVTSRQALHSPGEVVHPLDGLTVPDHAGALTAEECMASDAVRLFVERASATATGFTLTDADTVTVASVCARLDGLPLAIELVARMVRVLSVQEIAARLDDRMFTLTAAARTADPRHRSLHATIEWSHRLLTDDEQAVLRRLSVLVGGFGPEIAAAAGAAGNLPPDRVPAIVAALVEKSMVARVPDAAGPARYRMLESIRRYGLERLAAAGEEADTWDRIIGWLAGAAEIFAGQLAQEGQDLLRQEVDNVAPALEWLRDSGDERQYLLVNILVQLGVPGKAKSFIVGALAATDADSPHRSKALAGVAWTMIWYGDRATALRLALEALESERRWSRPDVLARIHRVVGVAQYYNGDLDSCLRSLEEGLRLAQAAGARKLELIILNDTAWMLLPAGELDRAAALTDRLLPQVAANPERNFAPAALHTAGVVALEQGNLAEARRRLSDALRLRPWRDGDAQADIEGLGTVAVRAGRAERALCLLTAARVAGDPGEIDGVCEAWWRQRVATAKAAARDALPPERAAAVEATGRALSLAETIRYALDDGATLPNGDPPPGSMLDARQWDVARLVADGLTNAEIGQRLHVSVRTVESQLRSVRDALGLRARAQIGAWAARQNTDTGTGR